MHAGRGKRLADDSYTRRGRAAACRRGDAGAGGTYVCRKQKFMSRNPPTDLECSVRVKSKIY